MAKIDQIWCWLYGGAAKSGVRPISKPTAKESENEREVDKVIAAFHRQRQEVAQIENDKLIGEALKQANTWRWTTDTKPGETWFISRGDHRL